MAVLGNIVVGASANTAEFDAACKKNAKSLGALTLAAGRTATAMTGINFGPAMNGLARVQGAFGKVGSAITSTQGILIGLGAFAGFAALGKGIVGAAKASSDLNEQASKASVVFGSSTSQVMADAKAMGDAFGYPKAQFIDGASSIGLIAKASGLSKSAAAGMGSSFAKLAADAASFFNVPVEEALMSIRSGLVGEAEPMRRFGVLLSAQAVEAEAARQGAVKLNGAYSEGAKVQARAALISRGMADAQGDMARTSGSAANMVRSAWGRLENIGADLGTAIQPVTDAILALANSALRRLGDEITTNQAAIKAWAEEAAASGGTVESGFTGFGAALGLAADTIQVIRLGLKGISALSAQFSAQFFNAIKTVNDFGVGAVKKLTGYDISGEGEARMQVFAEEFQSKADETAKTFQDAMNQGWSSSGINNFFEGAAAGAVRATTALAGTGSAAKQMGADIAAAGKQISVSAADITKFEQGLVTQVETMLLSNEETDLYKLKMKGATDEQLKTAAALAYHTRDMKLAKDVYEQTLTPAQKFDREMETLNRLLASDKINASQFAAAEVKASGSLGEMEKDLQAQIATFGKTAEQATLYKLSLDGWKDSELDSVGALLKQKAALEKAKEVFDGTRTPMEQYQKKLVELQKLHAAGKISDETFNRGVAGARQEITPQKIHSAAMSFGSQEARDTLLHFRGAGRTDDGLKDTARNTKEALAVQREIAAGIKRMADRGGASANEALLMAYNFP